MPPVDVKILHPLDYSHSLNAWGNLPLGTLCYGENNVITDAQFSQSKLLRVAMMKEDLLFIPMDKAKASRQLRYHPYSLSDVDFN